MKLIAVFLVLSMVVLMAEPADGFIGWLIKGAISGTLELFKQLEQLEQQQLEKRGFVRLG
uniref:Uncharacterized protein n=1 Tax=Sparus aurata TaxID=8175 RepID=A0A671VMW0_SPAAU